jgi:hypothetical protein
MKEASWRALHAPIRRGCVDRRVEYACCVYDVPDVSSSGGMIYYTVKRLGLQEAGTGRSGLLGR